MFFKDNRQKKLFIQRQQSPRQQGKAINNIQRFPQISNSQYSHLSKYNATPSQSIHNQQKQILETPKIANYAHKKTHSNKQKTSRYPTSQIVSGIRNYSSCTSSKQLNNLKISSQLDKQLSKKDNKMLVKFPQWQSKNQILFNQKQTQKMHRDKKIASIAVENCEKSTLLNFLKKIEENKKIIRNQICIRKEKDRKHREQSVRKKKETQENSIASLELEDFSFANRIKEVKQALKSLKIKNQTASNSTRIPSTVKLKEKYEKIYTQPSSYEEFQSTPIKQAYFKSKRNKGQIDNIQKQLINSNLSQERKQIDRQISNQKNCGNYSFQQQLERVHNFMEKGSSSLQKYVKLACNYHNPTTLQRNINSILVDRRQSYDRILNNSKIS